MEELIAALILEEEEDDDLLGLLYEWQCNGHLQEKI